MHGFQLWANLPASLKMTTPRYQEVKALDIPEIKDDDGTHVRVVCGNFWGKSGPVDGIAAEPIYLDVSVPPGHRKTLPVGVTRHAFAYVFAGDGKFCNASEPLAVPTEPVSWADTKPPAEADNRSLVLFDRGDEVMVQAGDQGIRFLLVSGKPLEEPVAWPHRDEHAGTAATGVHRIGQRDVFEAKSGRAGRIVLSISGIPVRLTCRRQDHAISAADLSQ
jgi:redox-sensitive bicupin YhaK (pirin superfamily)